MRTTRRTQPYRKGRRHPGPVLDAMRRGAPLFTHNPQDVRRATAKGARMAGPPPFITGARGTSAIPPDMKRPPKKKKRRKKRKPSGPLAAMMMANAGKAGSGRRIGY